MLQSNEIQQQIYGAFLKTIPNEQQSTVSDVIELDGDISNLLVSAVNTDETVSTDRCESPHEDGLTIVGSVSANHASVVRLFECLVLPSTNKLAASESTLIVIIDNSMIRKQLSAPPSLVPTTAPDPAPPPSRKWQGMLHGISFFVFVSSSTAVLTNDQPFVLLLVALKRGRLQLQRRWPILLSIRISDVQSLLAFNTERYVDLIIVENVIPNSSNLCLLKPAEKLQNSARAHWGHDLKCCSKVSFLNVYDRGSPSVNSHYVQGSKHRTYRLFYSTQIQQNLRDIADDHFEPCAEERLGCQNRLQCQRREGEWRGSAQYLDNTAYCVTQKNVEGNKEFCQKELLYTLDQRGAMGKKTQLVRRFSLQQWYTEQTPEHFEEEGNSGRSGKTFVIRRKKNDAPVSSTNLQLFGLSESTAFDSCISGRIWGYMSDGVR
ncbi:uncharacterized protein LOC110677678 [Aedes aegypti]|uniref:Uncharacterized protein n=1 Tax=Aedes aegypti TaxID=7159 RepID=A0A6I8U1N6_AEDAE|nr:uncharacterized protein LOC110677678 [Aedes aegypti]